VTGFLIENGFCFFREVKGSHQAWIKRSGNAELDKIVMVNFTHGSYPVRTLKTKIRQSGIPKEEWSEWAGS